MIGISGGSGKTNLKDHLGLRKVKSRQVSKTLNFLEKSPCVGVCETMLSDYQDKPKCIITADETWIYAHDLETTDQSSEYRAKGEATPSTSKSFKNQGHDDSFFDIRAVVHNEFLPPGQTVKKEYLESYDQMNII